ncbi:MAG: APC family permease [Bacteroidales bacterium]|nr:APC family permease [Bacteroidales bacterium]
MVSGISETESTQSSDRPRLRRVLGLWDLVFYGIVLVQPIAAIGLFGIASRTSGGHMVTTLIIAMAAMMLTAVSYGRMASLFPSAGSAYTYVGKGLNFHLGFLAGWAMFLDYLIVPVINTVYGSLTLQRLVPGVPFAIWVMIFVFIITYLNLRGIRTTARSNELLLAIMVLVIGMFIVLAVRYIFLDQGFAGLFSFKPFYNPETFDIRSVMTATSFAALTYIGFDGVTTLAEDVKNPRRNMLLAPVLVCLFTGLFSIIQIYLAQQVWPDFTTFPDLETAFYDVSRRVGGDFLFNAVALILFVACLGSGLAGQVSAARLLFAMGRDRILPERIFSHLSRGKATPTFNIIIMGVLTIVISMLISYQNAAELLNFGAFLAFMGVNIAALRQFSFLRPSGRKRDLIIDALLPAAGFVFCFVIWISLPAPAKITGGIWFLAGFVYLLIRTKGFREKKVITDFSNFSGFKE